MNVVGRFLHGQSTERIVLLLIGLSILFALPTVTFDFVSLDDSLLILGNKLIRSLDPRTIARMFSLYDPELYVPFTTLSFAVNYQMAGLNPWMYHLTNVLLHAANVALVFLIAENLSGRRVAAFLPALLFLVHPMNMEAIAWVSARKDLLSATFFLSSFFYWLRYRETSLRRWYAGSLLTSTLALLAKVSAVTLPVILLMTNRAVRRNEDDNQKTALPTTHFSLLTSHFSPVLSAVEGLLTLLPFFLLSIVFGVIAIAGKSGNIAGLTGLQTMLLTAKGFTFMLWKLVLPLKLSPLYPQVHTIGLASKEFFLPLLVCSIFLGFITGLRRHRSIADLLAATIILFLPSIFTFVKNGEIYFFSDRYAYLPAIPVFLLVSLAIGRLAVKFPRITTALVAMACVCLGVLSQAQLLYWKNSLTLFSHASALNPSSALARTNLGSALLDDGKEAEALTEFEAATDANPGFTEAWINRGNILRRRGDTTGALTMYRSSIESIDRTKAIRPDQLLGFYALGEVLLDQGKIDEGLNAFKQAADLAPTIAEAQYNLATMLHKYERTDESLRAYEKTIDLEPQNLDARYGLAAILAERGRLPEAKAQLKAIVSIDPTYEEAANHLERITELLKSQ